MTFHISNITNPLLPPPPTAICSLFSPVSLPHLPFPPLPLLLPRQASSFFAMCHISELTIPFLPLPPLQEVSPRLQCATFLSSPTHFSRFLPSSKWVGSSVIHMGNHNVPNALLFIGTWLHPPTHPSALTEIFCLLANWNPLHYTHATRCK